MIHPNLPTHFLTIQNTVNTLNDDSIFPRRRSLSYVKKNKRLKAHLGYAAGHTPASPSFNGSKKKINQTNKKQLKFWSDRVKSPDLKMLFRLKPLQ